VSTRKASRPVIRTGADGRFVVMACDDMTQADAVGLRLTSVSSGALVVYSRLEDLMVNPPAGRVAVVILDTHDSPAAISRALEWLRRRWNRCPVTVVGDAGGGDHEMAARQGGACFLTRPVTEEQWSSLLSHALRKQDWNGARESPGSRRAISEIGR
jgi:FixJ family two-component response regulator